MVGTRNSIRNTKLKVNSLLNNIVLCQIRSALLNCTDPISYCKQADCQIAVIVSIRTKYNATNLRKKIFKKSIARVFSIINFRYILDTMYEVARALCRGYDFVESKQNQHIFKCRGYIRLKNLFKLNVVTSTTLGEKTR